MKQQRIAAICLIVELGVLSSFVLWFPSFAAAQEELRAYRQIAYESGHDTLTVKKGPGDKYYALNRGDHCVWIFSSSGSSTGRISSIGMGPSDLLEPRDLAVDGEGNAIVADESYVKVFAPSGQLLTSFEFKRPHHVGALSDGRILVSGFPTDYLMTVLDKQGKYLAGIGTPAKVDDQPFFNAVLNMGNIVVDSEDNIYYVFRFMLTPTVRKYRPDGTLIAEWHVVGGEELARVVEQAKARYQEHKQDKSHPRSAGGVAILTAAGFDESTKTLWVATGRQLAQLDSSGRVTRVNMLARPDGGPLPADGLVAERDVIRVASELHGIYEFPKPH
jgi:hypothetical protein